MKRKSILALAQSLKDKTGISFESYQNPELAQTLSDLILFPQYALRIFIRPVLWIYVLFLIASLASFLISMKTWALILVLIGIIIALGNGGLFGAVLFIYQVGNDVEKVLRLSLEILQQILRDSQQKDWVREAKVRLLPKLSEMLNGVILLVILPILQEIIRKKVPFVAGFINAILSRIMMVWANRIQKKLQAEKEKAEELPEMIDENTPPNTAQTLWYKFCKYNITKVETLKNGISVSLRVAVRFSAFPFQFFLIMNIIFSWLAIFVLYYFMGY